MTTALLLLFFHSVNRTVSAAGPEKSAETHDQTAKSKPVDVPISEQLHQYASRTVYTVQTGSFMDGSDAQKQFDVIVQGFSEKDLDYLRIEKIGNYYSVRIGIFEDRVSADTLLRAMQSMFPAAMKLKAYIKRDRITKMYRGSSSVDKQTIEKKALPASKTQKIRQQKNDKSVQQTVPEIYTIQTGSFMNYDDAQKKYDSMVQGSNTRDLAYDISHLRIEKIGRFYTVRIGKFKKRDIAQSFLRAIKTRYPAAVIIMAHIKDDRIIKSYKAITGSR